MPPTVQKYHRGHVTPKNLAELIRASHERHGHRLKALVTPTAPTFDWTALGKVPPVHDQGQCGSCWDFSGTGTGTCAMIQAGTWPADGTMYFSEQYYLDCVSDGGCNGDDNTTVLEDLKTNGAPTIAEYGAYAAQSERCKFTSAMTKYKIVDWGYADSNGGQGVTSTADIKEALVTYGPVGCAVAAGDDWDNYTNGTITGNSTDINHDVMIVGWDDTHDNGDGTKGAWKVRNSWGADYGINGYLMVKYGADSIGTETVFAEAAAPSPVPTPTPTPTPPSPTPTPTPTDTTYTFTFDTVAQTVTLPPGFTVSTPTPSPTPSPTPTPTPVPGTIDWATLLQDILAILALFGPTPTKPKKAINWANIFAAIVANAPAVISLVESLISALTPVANRGVKGSGAGIIAQPATLEDLLGNADDYASLLATYQSLGITQAIAPQLYADTLALQNAQLQSGAFALAATDSSSNPVPIVTHNSLLYAVNVNATPAILVEVTPVAASSVAVAAPTPTPTPSS